ncbi:conserved exported hypothetical protein [Gammaproteobacteria bacterium]
MLKIKHNFKIIVLSIFILIVTSSAYSATLHEDNSINQNPLVFSKQIIVVIGKNWDSTSGILQRYERSNLGDSWQKAGGQVRVVLGKNGMAWGYGLHGDPLLAKEQRKEPIITTEGLKRSPVGAFEIPLAFGKDDAKDWGVKLPYNQISKTLYCSCDKSYNRIVDATTIEEQEDWDRGENMQSYVDDSGLYIHGAVIAHNYSSAIHGRGCCFFIHVWRSPEKPTAGCTAMASDNAKEIISWLEPQKKPVLVQFPEIIYPEFQSKWKLPDLQPSENIYRNDL